jgi:hypothetical protein
MQNAPIGAGTYGDWSGADIQSERRLGPAFRIIRSGYRREHVVELE